MIIQEDENQNFCFNFAREEHQLVLRSILISRAREGATLEEIRSDFYEHEGYKILLATERLIHILLSLRGVVCYSNSDGLLIFNILESEKSQHILSMVKRQKPAKITSIKKTKTTNFYDMKYDAYRSKGDLRNFGSLESIEECPSPASLKSTDLCYFRDNYQYLQAQHSGKKQQFVRTLDGLNAPAYDSVDLTSESEDKPRKEDNSDTNMKGSQNSLDSGIHVQTVSDEITSAGRKQLEGNIFCPDATTSELSHELKLSNEIPHDEVSAPNVVTNTNGNSSCGDPQFRKNIGQTDSNFQQNKLNINESNNIDNRNSHNFLNLLPECTNTSMPSDKISQISHRNESKTSGILSVLEKEQIDLWFKKHCSRKSSSYDPTINGYQLLGDDFLLFLARMELNCKFYPNKKVFQSGLCVSGQCISEAKKQVMEAQKMSTKIIVNVGSVDILHGHELVDIESDFLELIGAILSRDVEPILTTLAPLANHQHGSKKVILERFNLFIKELGHRCNFQVIDLWPIMVDSRTKMIYHCGYQQRQRTVTGSDKEHIFWSVIGRKKILNAITSATNSSRSCSN